MGLAPPPPFLPMQGKEMWTRGCGPSTCSWLTTQSTLLGAAHWSWVGTRGKDLCLFLRWAAMPPGSWAALSASLNLGAQEEALSPAHHLNPTFTYFTKRELPKLDFISISKE